jgi:hypothetical protein
MAALIALLWSFAQSVAWLWQAREVHRSVLSPAPAR